MEDPSAAESRGSLNGRVEGPPRLPHRQKASSRDSTSRMATYSEAARSSRQSSRHRKELFPMLNALIRPDPSTSVAVNFAQAVFVCDGETMHALHRLGNKACAARHKNKRASAFLLLLSLRLR